MAKQARLRSRAILMVGLSLMLCQCQQQNAGTTIILRVFVATNQLDWQQREGRLWLKNKLFDGWQYQLWPTGDTAFVGAFSQGKAEGVHRHWYASRQPKETRHYRNGWQEGEQRGWYESGKPSFVYHFRNDVYEGTQQEWYPNGQLAQEKSYHEGRENGTERMWFTDGSLKANYVARNGRNYGFTGVKNCVNVWDSIATSH